MSGYTDFFQPTPTPAPRPVEPVGFDLIRDLLERKMFGLQSNPYGMGGAQGGPGSLSNFSTGLIDTPAFGGSSSGEGWWPTSSTSGGGGSYNPMPSFGPRTMSRPSSGGMIPGARVPINGNPNRGGPGPGEAPRGNPRRLSRDAHYDAMPPHVPAAGPRNANGGLDASFTAGKIMDPFSGQYDTMKNIEAQHGGQMSGKPGTFGGGAPGFGSHSYSVFDSTGTARPLGGQASGWAGRPTDPMAAGIYDRLRSDPRHTMDRYFNPTAYDQPQPGVGVGNVPAGWQGALFPNRNTSVVHRDARDPVIPSLGVTNPHASPTQSPGSLAPPPASQPPAQGGAQDPTLGQGNFPWLSRWTGGFQAPPSAQENQALGGIGSLAGNNFNSNGAQDYINQLQSGQWLSPDNKYFDQIQNEGTTLKNTQDSRALQELQSRAAAGGNALSGGLMQQEGDYMRNSNASFNEMMAQLRANQYGQERGYMNQAPGMQNALTNTELGGLGQEMGMGAVPRNIQTNEMQGQYADWLRQINAMKDQYQYPDQMAMSLLNQGRYNNVYQPTTGDSGASQILQWLQQMGGGATGSNDWISILGGLLNGGGGDSSGNADAHEVHFDGKNPFSYQDQGFYNNALTNEQTTAAQQPQQKYSGLNAGLGTAGIIMAILGMLGKKGNVSSGSPGGGKSNISAPGGGGKSLLEQIFGGGGGPTGSYDKNSPFENPYGNMTNYTSGSEYDYPLGPDQPGSMQDYTSGQEYDYPIGPTQEEGPGGFSAGPGEDFSIDGAG